MPDQNDAELAFRFGVDFRAKPIQDIPMSFISRLALSGWAKIARRTLR
jgi:hypothetical protein